MVPKISHPTGKANYSEVVVGDVTLAFSYETVIGFYTNTHGYVVSENLWGTTTGKHINYFMPGSPASRMARNDFEFLLDSVLA